MGIHDERAVNMLAPVSSPNPSAFTFAMGAIAGALAALIVLKSAERRRTCDGADEEDHCAVSSGAAHDANLDERYPAPRRYGAVIRLKPHAYLRYRELHDDVWPQVLDRMTASNIRNFTIYFHAETSTLFQHFEWVGHWKRKSSPSAALNEEEEERRLFDLDMQAIANDPATLRWWKECEPCQEPFSQWPGGSKLLSDGGSGSWWAPLECVTHCGHWPVAYTAQQRDPDFQTMLVKPDD